MAYGDTTSSPKSKATGKADDEHADFVRKYKLDVQKANVWRKLAKEAYRFRDGDQYTEEEKRELNDALRPVVCFNRLGVIVDAVCGSEINNRRETRFIPRVTGKAKPNELLTSGADWLRDQCDAEDEESAAFKDSVTAGMGWTETGLDFRDNPAGDPLIDQVDPFEMVWDSCAKKPNLVDAKRLWRVRKVSLAEAKELLPGVDEEELNASWADNEDEDEKNPHHNNPGEEYAGDDDDSDGNNSPSKQVTLVACQYYKTETYYKAIIQPPPNIVPQMPELQGVQLQPELPEPIEVELSEAKFKIAKDAGAVLKGVKYTRRQVMQCWLGRHSIIKKAEPTLTGSFTWNCMTGLPDKEKGVFYGIVRRGIDPQIWANKFLSQMMHILNTQAKGGVMVEGGVFEDVRKAERDWARPDSMVEMSEGALSNPTGPKIVPKPVAQFPVGFDRLMQHADEMIVKATGVNMEMLGLREVNQPGVLEYQRKQQGIAILAPFFDGLRRYRKIQGRGMLFLIQNHLADGRLVKVVGEEQAQYVPMTKEEVTDSEYDTIVDDAPSSPNEKEKTFQILTSIAPMIQDSVGPELGMLMAEYSPLPTSFIEKAKALIEKTQANQPKPEEDLGYQLEKQKVNADTFKAGLEKTKLEVLAAVEVNKARELEINREIELAKLSLEGKRADHDRENKRESNAAAMQKANVDAASAATKASQDSESSAKADQMAQALALIGQALEKLSLPKKTTIGPRGPDGRGTYSITEPMVQ